MADPVSWAAIGSSVLAGGMSIAEGMSQSSAMKSQAKAAEYEAKIANLRGVQKSASRKEELNQALGAIDTIRAGRGLSGGSATARAIRSDRRERSRYAENNEVLSERLVGMSKRNEAAGLRAGAKWATIKGFGKAAGHFMKAGGDFGSMSQ